MRELRGVRERELEREERERERVRSHGKESKGDRRESERE
jgi:hypothetical protein